jgi:biotin carboxylase
VDEVVAVAADEGLGGVAAFGGAIRRSGRVAVLLTGPTGGEPPDDVYEQVVPLEDPYDSTALEEAALRAAGGRRLVALFSCYDGLAVPAAEAARRLGLPHPALDGLRRARNKHACREVCRRAGLATPPYALVSSEDDCARAAETVGFPVVLKPLNGLSSHLVRRVEGPEELAEAFHVLRERIAASFSGNYGRLVADGDGRRLDPRSTFLVEGFLTGPEFSAELVVRGGAVRRVALFHKLLVEEPGFLECGFAWPGVSDADERAEALWRHVEGCVAALRIDDCAVHAEVVETEHGPVLVEANAGRAGGQILVRAVRDAIGVDLIEEILALQTGEPAPPSREPTLAAPVTTLTFFPREDGRLEAIEGLEAVAALPGVVEVITFCRPGDELAVRDRELFAVNVLVAGVEPDAVPDLYERGRELVRFRIESPVVCQNRA